MKHLGRVGRRLYWAVDAKPFLVEIGAHMRDLALEAVLIGNAAAALQGAPVTTIDFDSCFPRPRGMRDRASVLEIDGVPIRVAALADIIRSKRAARRSRDLAVLEILEKTLEEASGTTRTTARPRRRR